MENEQDSLDKTAHAFGVTDLEIEQREELLAELAAQQMIRRRMEEEEADRQALKNFPNSGEDFDFGFHDQFDF